VLRLPGRDAILESQAQGMAFVAAVLWLVHPLNTQAVSYIAQRYESLMGLFFLVTLYCVARGANGIGKSHWLWYAAAIIAGWCGMFSKEVMATVLIVGPLFDRAFLTSSWRDVLRQRGWVYAAIAPSLIAMLLMQRAILLPTGDANASAGFALQGISPWEYFRTQPEIILHYLGLACLPRQLIFDYAWPVQNDLLRAGISGLVVTLIFVGSVALYIRRPRWGFAAVSFFLILGPTSSFMPIADLAVEHGRASDVLAPDRRVPCSRFPRPGVAHETRRQ
jgi:protein O-mannosyl-transferase